jgi:hypothetical protein
VKEGNDAQQRVPEVVRTLIDWLADDSTGGAKGGGGAEVIGGEEEEEE